MSESPARKIKLPSYCNSMTGVSRFGREDCDHDYPPESKKETDHTCTWTCSVCGMERTYEVLD